MYQNCSEEKHVDLLSIGKKSKRHYVLIKDFDTFMYNHRLHRGRKHFPHYCLQAFSTTLKLMVNERLKCRKNEYL